MNCSKNCGIAVIERCLETELNNHLGYPRHGRKGSALGNTRNGSSQKTLKGEQGHVDIEVPRDRQGTGLTAAREKGANAAGGHRSTKSWPCMLAA
jgi:transposase-like protein